MKHRFSTILKGSHGTIQRRLQGDRIGFALWPTLVLIALVSAAPSQADEPEMDAAVAWFDGPMIEINEQQIIYWAFENQGTFEDARNRTEQLLAGQIEFIAVIGTLTPEQRRRLLLAGEGDISRFFADAQRVISEQPRGSLPQDEWQQVYQRLSPIRERYTRGLTGRGSLFEKTIRATLTAEQWQAYHTLVQERNARNYRALVAATVAEVEIKLPLTADQRSRLIELAVKKTTPPTMPVQSYMQYAVVLYKLSKLSDDEFKPIFLEGELQLLRALMQQAQGWGRQIEQMEEGNGGGAGLLQMLF